MVVGRMRDVFNCQLQWSACVFDHMDYLIRGNVADRDAVDLQYVVTNVDRGQKQ